MMTYEKKINPKKVILKIVFWGITCLSEVYLTNFAEFKTIIRHPMRIKLGSQCDL